MEDFVFKLEGVVETKVAYFYTPSPKNSKVSDHDSNPSQTMTLTACPAANVSGHDSNRLPSGAIGFVTVSGHDSNRAWDLT